MKEADRRTTLSEVFLDLKLPQSARILDVACGTGIVAEELRQRGGYDNIDGLDPVKGYLETAQDKKLYRVRKHDLTRKCSCWPFVTVLSGYLSC